MRSRAQSAIAANFTQRLLESAGEPFQNVGQLRFLEGPLDLVRIEGTIPEGKIGSETLVHEVDRGQPVRVEDFSIDLHPLGCGLIPPQKEA